MSDFFANLSKDDLTNLVKIFDVQIAIIIIVVVFLTKNVFTKFIINIVNKILKRKADPKESGMYNTIKYMYVFLGIYLAVEILPITGNFLVIVRTLFKIALIIFVTQLINNIILTEDSIIFKNAKKNNKVVDEHVNKIIFKILRVVAWIISIFIIFSELGYDLSGLITGLGLGTVIISLAAQETVTSLLSGLTILSDKPFIIGDWIKVGDYSGSVINITFRSTRIKCVDNSIVNIPNSKITSESVINWSKLKTRRLDYTLNLEMGTSIEKIQKLVKELKVVISSKDYVKEDTVYVGFSDISEYSSDIKIYFYITEIDYGKYLDIKQDFNLEFLQILEKENIALAYPTQTIEVKNIDT